MTANPLAFWLGLVLVLLGRAWYDLWRARRALRYALSVLDATRERLATQFSVTITQQEMARLQAHGLLSFTAAERN